LVLGLAAAAALAIDNARMHERAGELSLLGDRERIGRDLHDTVVQSLFATGLDTRKTCLFVHHERYDEAYRRTHAAEFDKIFPLYNMCNAHADLVPAWVNPTIAVCVVVALAAAAVLLWFVTTHVIKDFTRANAS